MTREDLAPPGKEWIANVHRSCALDDIGYHPNWTDLEFIPIALTKAGKKLPWAKGLYGRKVTEAQEP